jgi:hypothetical protein
MGEKRTNLRFGPERGEPFTFLWHGRPVLAYPGETIAAALLAAGERTIGTPGYFCGIGICQGCRLMVNGVHRRACTTPAAANLNVESIPVLL